MKKILIIGCGLLGSSLLRRIQKKKIANKIYIYEKSKSCIAKIKRLKLPGIIVKRLEEGVKKSDLIILCTPMSEYKNLILKMNKFLLTKTIITDVGSSKLESSKIIKKFLRKDVCWTQSHPIAGSEVSGPEHGKHDIFEKKWCVLIKEKSTKKKHLSMLGNFWRKIGSKVVVMTPEKHDKIFSMTSHLPHLIAFTIVGTASDLEHDLKNDVIRFSASGFRDFTRIAASDPTMWRDVFMNNEVAVLEMLQRFNEDLSYVQKAIRKGEGEKLYSLFERTAEIRRSIIDVGQATD